jgi:hypothetical protein
LATGIQPAAPPPRHARLAAHLSAPRLGPYLAAADGNHKDALRLYAWNIDLSGAAYEALHIVEVVLRNAIDRELCSWNAQQIDTATALPHSPDWLMDPARLLVRLSGNDLKRAQDRARKALGRGRQPAHPDVLAQLSFGTWRFLLPDKDRGRQLLWNQAIHRSFPHLATDTRQLVANVHSIYQLRNRVAHLEPLLAPGAVRAEYNAMRSVLAAIEPVAEQWFTSRQRITAELRARPL